VRCAILHGVDLARVGWWMWVEWNREGRIRSDGGEAEGCWMAGPISAPLSVTIYDADAMLSIQPPLHTSALGV